TDTHPAGLRSLDAAGAAGRGQCGHAQLSRGGSLMAVVGFDVTLRRGLADGKPFDDVGPYEELKGRLRYAIDPAHAANRGVTDVTLAPTNAAGLVEFSADLSLLVPVDRARASGRALIDVVNRGNTVSVPNFNHATRPAFVAGSDPNPPIDVGDGFLMRRGYVVASCGWQFDLPEVPGLIRLHGVEARVEHGRVTPDPRHVALDGGFAKGRLYHLAYTATGAQVIGLGLVALRDCAAWLKHGEAPVRVRRAYAYGRSQTGRLLRTLIHD